MDIDENNVFGDLALRVVIVAGMFACAVIVAGFSLTVGDIVASLVNSKSMAPGIFSLAVDRLWGMVIIPITTPLLVLYAPCLIWFIVHFIHADNPTAKMFGYSVASLSLIYIFTSRDSIISSSFSDPSLSQIILKASAVVIWLLFAIGIQFAVKMYDNYREQQRIRYVMMVTAEIEADRQSNADQIDEASDKG